MTEHSEKRVSLYDMSIDQLAAWLTSFGEKPFRARQIHEWLWKKGVQSIDEMTNLSLSLRSALKRSFLEYPLTQIRREDSDDKETTKFLWQLADGAYVETVLIRAPGRYTVCVSSQVGCPARCGFCASGRKGLIRNLTAAEIVTQALSIQSYLEKSEAASITNVVYMGMGEPMKNYESVVSSIRFLSDPNFFGMSQRRITVSTVGVVGGIIDFAKEGLKVNLVLSLHAPNQAIRQKIIPYARQYDIHDVLKAMEYYQASSGRDSTYEYTLISGINDSTEHAEELSQLLRGKQCTVNLIPYNPVLGLRLKRPERQDIELFRSVLDSRGISHTCRYTKGVDIAAACGQLALKESDVKKSPLNVL